MNLSKVSDHATARTDKDCSDQRAFNLAALGCNKVLELCCGPSLRTLEKSYSKYGLSVCGNDIEQRWQRYYPTGNWIIGDALKVSYLNHDAIVFAPPLSKGCTGKREDALMINQVFPRYDAFLEVAAKDLNKKYVLVCPARSLATSNDREQLHHLLNKVRLYGFRYDAIQLKANKRQITKYLDIYLYN